MVKTCTTLKLLPERKLILSFFLALQLNEIPYHRSKYKYTSVLYIYYFYPDFQVFLFFFFFIITVEFGFTMYGHEAFVPYIQCLTGHQLNI